MAKDKKIVGFIGLGNMGMGMAKNLVRKGYSLVVHDINENAVKQIVEMGAKSAGSPKETAASSDVVLTVLPGPREVSKVMFGPEGILEAMRSGGVIFDMTTSEPALIRKVGEAAKQKQITVLDAPLSGGQPGADAGTLTIMVGGNKEVLDKHRDILEAVGKKVFYAGELGSGSIVKITLNAMLAVHTIAIGEAFAAGVKAGASPKTLFEIIINSTGQSWLLENRVPYPGIVPNSFTDNDFEPGFRMVLMAKDLGLMEAMGKEYGVPVLMSALAKQMYAAAIYKGMGDKDWTAVYKLYQEF